MSDSHPPAPRTALVTGASVGIGAAIARRFAAAGIRTAVHFNRGQAEAAALVQALPGAGHIACQADFSDPTAARTLVDQVAEEFGAIDILVNNAGVYELSPFGTVSFETWQSEWQRILDINLMSSVHAAWSAIRHMRESGGGKIISVASRSAFRAETDAPAYAVSKAGLVSLTRCLARAEAHNGILAYCIAPGWVETAMAREGMEAMGAQIVSEIPLRRIASVDDVAGVAMFLASADADYLTGVTIDVNGGSYLH
ncbi:MAG: SDR family oxidoreductase [Armatimonadetes bacterium]|nr:SDR family oxidoreductase [Armatimonadota bacterium]MDE2206176.1 SDR family oxidoreductase [Armatimonadota bacterium]